MLRYLPVIVAALLTLSMPVQAQSTSDLTEEQAFDAVFADPGNVLLNFQLASIQLKNGNIKEAAGTLERILILLPSNAEAQTLLARVQLSLGNQPEAERLSNIILANDKATAAQKAEATTIIAAIKDAKSAYQFSGAVTVGGGVADNPEGGSRGNLAEQDNGTFSKRAHAEEFTSASLTVNIKRRFISQLPQDINLALSLSSRDYATYDAGDLATFGLTALYSDTFQSGVLRTSVGATRIHIADRHYMNSYSGNVTYLQGFDNGWSGSVGGSVVRQVLKEDANGTGTEKSGNNKTLTVGLGKSVSFGRFTLDTRSSTSRATQMKEAKKTNGVALGFSSTYIPGVTSVTFDYAEDKYRDIADPYSATKKRHDKISTVRLNYLMGLETLSAPNGDEAYLQFAVKYSQAKSNIANFHKYSGDASLSVTKPF